MSWTKKEIEKVLNAEWEVSGKESNYTGLSIIAKDIDIDGEFLPYLTVVKGGGCEGYPVGVLSREIAEYIVQFHNGLGSSIETKKERL